MVEQIAQQQGKAGGRVALVGAPLPAFITFTGVDEWTDLDRVEELSRRYPIEWGILFSPKQQGQNPRYPSLFAVDRITTRIGNLRLAAHLCGGHARSVLLMARCPELTSWIDCAFGRFQINTSDPTADPRMVARFADNHGGMGILQCQGLFPNTSEVDWLQDASGGRGEAPDKWLSPEERGPFVGYAGGLGPDTIGEALAVIQATLPPHTPYWIDMESRIRTDDRLDLDKCEAVCRAVYGPSPPTPMVPQVSQQQQGKAGTGELSASPGHTATATLHEACALVAKTYDAQMDASRKFHIAYDAGIDVAGASIDSQEAQEAHRSAISCLVHIARQVAASPTPSASLTKGGE